MSLREYLFINYITATKFAKEMGVTPVYMRMVARGAKIPSRKLAQQIEVITGGQVTVKELRGGLDE